MTPKDDAPRRRARGRKPHTWPASSGIAALRGACSNIPSDITRDRLGPRNARTLADYLGPWINPADTVTLTVTPDGDLEMRLTHNGEIVATSPRKRERDFTTPEPGKLATTRNRSCQRDAFGRACSDAEASLFVNSG